MGEEDAVDREAGLREEREFVLALGGYALEIPGGTLVTNERVPVPAFNFVQEVRIGPERQAAFFERALDHYFQRALRPTFRVPEPVPAHVERTLRSFAFRAREERLTLLVTTSPPSRPALGKPKFRIRPARVDEIDRVSRFWSGEREGEELRRALTVVLAHPNPGERLVPTLALDGERPLAAALAYTSGDTRGIHAVATEPQERGRGAATELVASVLASKEPKAPTRTCIFAESARLEQHLKGLGFRSVGRWVLYELPPDAELTLPSPGPPQPPRWRPPRRGPAGEAV